MCTVQSWEICLKDMLLRPLPHVEVVSWGSVYIRLSRHYVFLYLAVLVGWTFKLFYSDVSNQITIALAVFGITIIVAIVIVYFRPPDGGFGFLFTPSDSTE